MILSSTDIQRIARLSKLEFSETQSTDLQEQLNAFFELVKQISTVSTEQIEPLYHPLSMLEDIHLRLQADIANSENQRTTNMQNAPEAQDGLFLVPKVIE